MGTGNQALNINTNTQNGKHVDIAITVDGSDWYWTVCACMTAATFAFIGLAATKPRSDRIFHYITSGVTLVAAIAYFSMASNLGWTPINVEFVRSDPVVRGMNREIFYVRYIDWFITTPLLLMDLLLTAGMPWPTVLWVILVDEVMIVTGLVGALVKTSYKWGYYTFGCVALFFILYHLVWESRRHANVLGKDVGRAFLMCGSLTSLLWCLYPIAWGLCEGGNVISPDSEAIFYGILDLFAKPVFGALLMWGHRGINPTRLGLSIRDYTGDDLAVHEKSGGVHNNGVSNGHHGTTVTPSGGVTTDHSNVAGGMTSAHHGNATGPTGVASGETV